MILNRGFDFGNHFCEWMMNNAYEKHPYFQYNFDYYPTRAQQIDFLTAYVDEFKRTLKETQAKRQSKGSMTLDDDANSESQLLDENLDDDKNKNALRNLNIEHLLIEANYFALASHLSWALWGVSQAATCKIKFEYLVRFSFFFFKFQNDLLLKLFEFFC